MNRRSRKTRGQDLLEILSLVQSMSNRAIRLRVLHKVWIRKVESKVFKPHRLLFPLDHAVPTVVDNDDDEMQSKSYGRFQFLRIHHESAVAAHRDDRSIRIDELGGHR